MRAFGLPLMLRCCFTSSILLVSLICRAQQPQDSQSCTGDPVPLAARKAQPAQKDSSVAATANLATHTIRLTWTESVSPASTVEGYYVYRRESGPPCQVHPNECEPLNLRKPVKGGGCTDYSVVSGHTYTYQAQTVGKNTVTSTFSNDAIATAR